LAQGANGAQRYRLNDSIVSLSLIEGDSNRWKSFNVPQIIVLDQDDYSIANRQFILGGDVVAKMILY